MKVGDSYDVVVMGGGPAGATSATLLAEAGRRVLVVERREVGEFKIGESLMPATYSTFERLGVLERLKRSHFPKKYSVQFYAKSGRASAPFYFFEDDPEESSQTWQVLRSEFDQILLERAAECGAEVQYRTGVRDVLFDEDPATGDDRATGVRLQLSNGDYQDVAAEVVLDATGQRAFLARRLGIVDLDPHLRHASIYTHFEGGYRDQGIDEGATLILRTRDGESWFWYLPMPGDRVSVGVVGGVDYLVSSRPGNPQEVFFEEVEKCSEVKKRLVDSVQVREMNVLRDFSYKARQMAGPGWLLLGDAYSFIDPVYSSGILLALRTGEMGADAVLDAFEHDDFSAERLSRYQPLLEKGMESIRSLVHSFYSKDFSFGAFLRKYPEHQEDIVDILVGRVFDREFDLLFSHMAEMFKTLDLPLRVSS